ncbi:MAG: ABC transporter ATP-binding protein [Agathobacter sp.]|jgi:putative ABC transport system ATP-binding protein|uniref:ABC transporter ATP-binding protein n=1 Tax=Agathobacter sp. TaxID=2021311 RepID=UPI0027FB033A|nr:ABC transporter ATP-binding protein [uncultured Agathobacter sp.]MBD8926954.1 ABC transporter ATP-binding protein [Agathobacter rectalis]MCI7113080.1 ABC transporter ATP-binding protein [Lachnobacterium sp.]MDY6156473.1 ABC transporter ATP-binding protein [Agathobacter sp.]MEE1034020.1 ABC transporter ATP-binding protein [Agathobacter sp.]
MILELKNIYKNYDQDNLVVPVLKDVSLQVDEGEYVAVMGPSGSGKTTLMNIIGCLDLPTSGSYILDGRPVSELKEKELTKVRRNILGFVFQNFQLMPRESALDNVCLPLIYAGVSKKERKEMGMKALEKVGLADRAAFRPNQLSGGQKQRVAIARAMVNNPKLLLADEPTGALDSKSGKQVLELFDMLNESGVTIVMITHDRKVAERAKRIVHIIDGEISEEGQEVKHEEEKGN